MNLYPIPLDPTNLSFHSSQKLASYWVEEFQDPTWKKLGDFPVQSVAESYLAFKREAWPEKTFRLVAVLHSYTIQLSGPISYKPQPG